MSAVYTSQGFAKEYASSFQQVIAWFASNEGQSIEACATALSLPYQVVFQVIQQGDFVILPSASAEIQFQAHGKKG